VAAEEDGDGLPGNGAPGALDAAHGKKTAAATSREARRAVGGDLPEAVRAAAPRLEISKFSMAGRAIARGLTPPPLPYRALVPGHSGAVLLPHTGITHSCSAIPAPLRLPPHTRGRIHFARDPTT
jgi:hypothetical protein